MPVKVTTQTLRDSKDDMVLIPLKGIADRVGMKVHPQMKKYSKIPELKSRQRLLTALIQTSDDGWRSNHPASGRAVTIDICIT